MFISLFRHRPASGKTIHGLLLSCLLLSIASASLAGDDNPHTGQSAFLVASEKLHGTSFAQTVILLTHLSRGGGAIGLAINRPSGIPLKEAFPKIRQLRDSTEPLFLGGPVSSDSIFVLLRTQHPKKGMLHLINDIYFVPGQDALRQPSDGRRRAYAGYAGWAPGQLQAEIERGDWRLIHTDPGMIFDDDTSGLWEQLMQNWSGKWI